MALRLTATTLKSFFQYRCERQARYMMMSAADREALPIQEKPDDDAVWTRVGIDFEEEVVTALSRQEPVLRPPRGEKLAAVQTAAFLRRQCPEGIAYQPRLALSSDEGFRRRWQVASDVELAAAYPDLLRALPGKTGPPVFRLIDIKAVHVPALFHKIQVAYYSLLLDAVLREANLAPAVDPVAEIWHFDAQAAPGEVRWQTTLFRLKGYQSQVADFLRGPLGRIARTTVGRERDGTRFHLYFKCEQCEYLPHCSRAVADELPINAWDVSAVPGLSQTSKATLVQLGIRTVGSLAGAGTWAESPLAGWALRTEAELLRRRAQTLLEGRISRVPGRMTYRMPPRIDAAFYLLFDQDPVEGRLAALGFLFEQGDCRDFTVAAVARPGAQAERDALLKVLGAVVARLLEIDGHNAAHGKEDPWYAHLFVYEPSEARDLQGALGRHLGDAAVRGQLLDLVRMFPPEPLHPEPEYRGVRHLPATALRGVLDSLYAIPVKVSHDLRAVSAAFAAADPPLAEPYRPGPAFRRPFSSRLNIDACRLLKAGHLAASEVEEDVRARLRALAGLARWVLADNNRGAVPFLRLNKQPFRLQSRFDPLGAEDLDLLCAQELLASRSTELSVLTALAAPVTQRKASFRCLAPLRLLGAVESPRPWAARRLRFHAPPDCLYTELGPGSFGVVLSDNDPDLLLDPSRWPDLFVTISDLEEDPDGLRVTVDVARKVWRRGTLERLLQTEPPGGWCLDQAHSDENAPRLQRFLQYLGGEAGPS
jgi:predicted RecB family nuclease